MSGVTFGKSAVDTIESLKPVFGVSTMADVVSKALDLAKLIADQADDKHTVLLASKDGTPIEVHLAGD